MEIRKSGSQVIITDRAVKEMSCSRRSWTDWRRIMGARADR